MEQSDAVRQNVNKAPLFGTQSSCDGLIVDTG